MSRSKITEATPYPLAINGEYLLNKLKKIFCWQPLNKERQWNKIKPHFSRDRWGFLFYSAIIKKVRSGLTGIEIHLAEIV